MVILGVPDRNRTEPDSFPERCGNQGCASCRGCRQGHDDESASFEAFAKLYPETTLLVGARRGATGAHSRPGSRRSSRNVPFHVIEL
jgi:hypothetical protein